MQYNPYATEYDTIANRLLEVQREATTLHEQLQWHGAFRESAANSALIEATTLAVSLQKELANTIAERRQRQSSADVLNREMEVRRGLWRWFSGEHSRKQKLLNEQQDTIQHLTELEREIQRKIAAPAAQRAMQEAELERYRGFNKSAVEADFAALNIQLAHLESELERVRRLKEDFDHQFAGPTAALDKAKSKKRALEREINHAKSLDQRLSKPTTAAERASIHSECSSAFGVSTPKKVINAKLNELTSLDRKIEKLENRLRSEAKLASVEVKGFVLDGSNLCFQQGDKFIGLSALDALAENLSRKYAVTIVFDGTMRPYLTSNCDEIAFRFPDNVSVFVLASKLKADETVLDAATDPRVFIISNDGFGDFPEKPAVRDGRVLNHEIAHGKIRVQALNVEVAYETTIKSEMQSAHKPVNVAL